MPCSSNLLSLHFPFTWSSLLQAHSSFWGVAQVFSCCNLPNNKIFLHSQDLWTPDFPIHQLDFPFPWMRYQYLTRWDGSSWCPVLMASSHSHYIHLWVVVILFDIQWGYSPKICLWWVGFQHEMRRPQTPLHDYPLPCILIQCHTAGVVVMMGVGSRRAEGGFEGKSL